MLLALRFWFIVQLFSLAALPLIWRWLAALPSRGYALAKPLGLLLVAYALWLGSSLGFLRNSVGGILLSWALVAALALWLGRAGWLRQAGGRRPLLDWLRANWRLVAAVEALFLVALLGWAFIRSYSPEITTAGGEKFMELTFLNGILRSERFPPLDPWLSGFAISYYYFGYVMLAILTRLSGLASSVAFNVGLATWFALTVAAAFGIAFDMAAALGRSGGDPAHDEQDGGRPPPAGGGLAFAGGLLGSLFVALLSNLAGFLESMQGLGLGSLAFWRWLDIKDLNCLAGPSYIEPLANCPQIGGLAPQRFFWWWRASRVINDRDLLGSAIEVIDEFPFFSFLLGDMHPHVLALPFVLLAIGLALALVLSRRDDGREAAAQPGRPSALAQVVGAFPLGRPGFALYALCLGGLAFLNTWDFPIYVLLVTLALGARLALSGAPAGRALLGGVGLGLLGGLLYLPFYVGFQSQAGGILPNFIFPTRLSQLFVMFGPLLLAAVLLLLALSGPWQDALRRWLRFLPWTVLPPLVFLLIMLAVGALTPGGRALVQRLMELPVVREQTGDASLLQLAGAALKLRLATPWTYLLLAGLLAWTLSLLAARRPRFSSAGAVRIAPSPAAVTTFALLALFTALLLVFSVEFVYLRDTFGTRMNTVFKFYYQAWVLLALVAAFAVIYLIRHSGRFLRAAGLPLLALLAAAGLFYPVLATYTRAEGFASQPTLDGVAYLARQNPDDAAAIAWLQANAPGAATVLEASGGSYTYFGRISAQTGLPTLLGWDGHELQWRGDAEEQSKRIPAIERIYQGAPLAEMQQLLEQWQIDYVVVGQLERRTYGVSPQSEARLAQIMDLVYDAESVRIYRRRF